MAKRINFGKLQEVLPIPDLIGLQIDSYRDFLQKDVPHDQRVNAGAAGSFQRNLPDRKFRQTDFTGICLLRNR